MSELPPGWATAALQDVADVIAGQAPPGSSYNKEGTGVPLYQGKTDFGDLRVEPPRIWTTKPSKRARAGDVLLSVRAPVGPTNFAREDCAIGRGLAAIRGRDGIDQSYLLYVIRATVGELERQATGTTFSAISSPVIRDHTIPVAPAAEQERIVAAIEEQFSRLDAAVGAVERAVLNLKRMRGAVLQATMTGTLVSGDRDAQGVTALLDELLESRREASRSQRRYVQPVEPLRSTTALPSQWAWVSLDMLSESSGAITDGPFGSNLKSAHYTPSGPRVIRLQNIGDGEFLDAEAHISQEHFQRLSKHAVRRGDLVCALLGETTPRAAIVPDDLGPAIVKADCPRVRLSSLVNHRFVWAALNAPSTRREASARIHGVGRPRLNLKELREIPIPLPPRAEQDLLVDAMDRQLDGVYRLEADLIARRDMSEVLRSSILAAAFSGMLVQQDPNDEPALALLQRIAAEGADARDGYRAIPHQRRRKASV